MIERLCGVVVAKGEDGVVMSVGGVGFLVDVSSMTMGDVPALGEQAELFTYLHVREEALQLFGFSTEEERGLFRMLIGVSKIGPKLALAALSIRRAPELKRALAAGDVALFDAVPGIGRKTAERIILELREKIGQAALLGGGETSGEAGVASDSIGLARAALVELGYTSAEAEKLLVGSDADSSVEELVRRALAGEK